MSDLIISEVFGPTFQGEGPSVGRRAAFVRLGLCNLDCSWCDAAYTWDWKRFDRDKELTRTSPEAIIMALTAMDPSLVVITGGEPLVQRVALLSFIAQLVEHVDVEIETNGTLPPTGLDHHRIAFNVSPKLAHSGVDQAKAFKLPVLEALEATGRARFKFVCQTVDDLHEVARMVGMASIDHRHVWIMAEGTTVNTVRSRERELADPVLEMGWNMTPRFHIDLWGDTRGH